MNVDPYYPRRKCRSTRMRGKAQPDGRPVVELIETLVLISLIVAKVHVQCHFSINNILLQ